MGLPRGARYLAFADDVAIIAKAPDSWQLENILDDAAERIRAWLQYTGLQLAVQKSEVLVISRRRRHNELALQIGGTPIIAGKDLKYLGVQVDGKLSFMAMQE